MGSNIINIKGLSNSAVDSKLQEYMRKDTAPITADSGIKVDKPIGSDIYRVSHTNWIEAPSTPVGSSTQIPVISFDNQGHITDISTTPISNAGYTGEDGISVDNNSKTVSHTNAVEGGANEELMNLAGMDIPVFAYDAQGHLTKTKTVPIPDDLYTVGDGLSKTKKVISHSSTGATSGTTGGIDSYLSSVTIDKFGHVTGAVAKVNKFISSATAELKITEKSTTSGKRYEISHTDTMSVNPNKWFGGDGKTVKIRANTSGHILEVGEDTISFPVVGAKDGLGVDPLDKNIKHTNTIQSQTIGALNTIPILSFDEFGHITSVDSKPVTYPEYTATDGIKKTGNAFSHTNSVNPGSAGSSELVPVISWDAQGHITSGSVIPIKFPVTGASKGLKEVNGIIEHTNSIVPSTSAVGGSTEVPVISWDAQGHVTAISSENIAFPITGAKDGLVVSGSEIGHSNSITAGSVGSATSIPIITYDSFGHISGIDSAIVYPPTSKPPKGKYWGTNAIDATVGWQSIDINPTQNSSNLVSSGGVYNQLSNKAPFNHADTSGKYGVASDTEYGHVKIQNTVIPNSTDAVTSGAVSSGLSDLSVDVTSKLSLKQDILTAGDNISIVDNVISAKGEGAKYTGGLAIDITANNVIQHIANPVAGTYNTYEDLGIPNYPFAWYNYNMELDGAGHITNITESGRLDEHFIPRDFPNDLDTRYNVSSALDFAGKVINSGENLNLNSSIYKPEVMGLNVRKKFLGTTWDGFLPAGELIENIASFHGNEWYDKGNVLFDKCNINLDDTSMYINPSSKICHKTIENVEDISLNEYGLDMKNTRMKLEDMSQVIIKSDNFLVSNPETYTRMEPCATTNWVNERYLPLEGGVTVYSASYNKRQIRNVIYSTTEPTASEVRDGDIWISGE